jgi:hypothetical protein
MGAVDADFPSADQISQTTSRGDVDRVSYGGKGATGDAAMRQGVRRLSRDILD